MEGDGIRNPHGGLLLDRNQEVNPYSGRGRQRIQGERTGGWLAEVVFLTKKKIKTHGRECLKSWDSPRKSKLMATMPI